MALSIGYTTGSDEHLADIVVLQERLGVVGIHACNYTKVHNDAENDHKVELPFMSMARVIDRLQEAKNKHYQNSYSKRGVLSIFFNMERKWDRMDKQIFSDLSNAASETFLDTCIDLAAYAVKLCAWICARRPEMYRQLLQSVEEEGVAAGTLAPAPPVNWQRKCRSLPNEEPADEEGN
jgi:hypothetical protein